MYCESVYEIIDMSDQNSDSMISAGGWAVFSPAQKLLEWLSARLAVRVEYILRVTTRELQERH